jgi:hypothetical protein
VKCPALPDKGRFEEEAGVKERDEEGVEAAGGS